MVAGGSGRRETGREVGGGRQAGRGELGRGTACLPPPYVARNGRQEMGRSTEPVLRLSEVKPPHSQAMLGH